jgi:hypothetical protein
MNLKLLQGALIVAIALYLVPTGAHLFEMPAKMALPASDYMVVQRIYNGWQIFGVVIGAALLLALAQAYLVRSDRPALVAAVVGLAALAAALAGFLMFALPVNVATTFWTVVPEPFEAARRQWEYSHAVAAVLTFLALVASLASILRFNGTK